VKEILYYAVRNKFLNWTLQINGAHWVVILALGILGMKKQTREACSGK
jgi:hypothetical protein